MEDGKWVPVNARIAGVRVRVQDVVKKRGVCVRVWVWGYMAVECGLRLCVVQVIKIVFGLSTSFWRSFLVSTPATSSSLPRSTLSWPDVYNCKISNSP